MKFFLQALFLSFIVASCGLVKNTPAAPSTDQVVVNTDDDILITETFAYHEETNSVKSDDDENTAPGSPAEIKIRHFDNQEKTLQKSPRKDTLVLTQDDIDRAVDSERVAKNAHIWSFIPLLTLVFGFLAFILGIVMTLILINKVRKMPFVTQKALDRIQKARRTLLWTTVGLLVGLLILLLVLLAVAIALL